MALIVVLDDDETLRLLVSKVLRREQHVIVEAEDGQAGLQLVRMHKPDLVISDVQMPRMDGVALLDLIRADPALALTPVILCTSLAERTAVRAGMTHGADDYLTKPFRPEELIAAVNTQLARRTAQQIRRSGAILNALDSQRESFSEMFDDRLRFELAALRAYDDEPDTAFSDATLVYSNLPSVEGTSVLQQVERAFLAVSDMAYLFGATHLQVVGTGLLLVFADSDEDLPVQQELRAVRAARMLAASVQATNSEPVVLLNGAITLTSLANSVDLMRPNERIAVGASVNAILHMHELAASSPDHHRRVFATREVVDSLADEISTADSAVMGSTIVEITGLTQMAASAPTNGKPSLKPGELEMPHSRFGEE
jgi:CheY-like chemotaxis protein